MATMLTDNQKKNISDLALISDVAEKLAQVCNQSNVSIDSALPMIRAIAQKKLLINLRIDEVKNYILENDCIAKCGTGEKAVSTETWRIQRDFICRSFNVNSEQFSEAFERAEAIDSVVNKKPDMIKDLLAKAAKAGFTVYNSYGMPDSQQNLDVLTCTKGKYNGETIDIRYDWTTGIVTEVTHGTQFPGKTPIFQF